MGRLIPGAWAAPPARASVRPGVSISQRTAQHFRYFVSVQGWILSGDPARWQASVGATFERFLLQQAGDCGGIGQLGAMLLALSVAIASPAVAAAPAEIQAYAVANLKPMIDRSTCTDADRSGWPSRTVKRCVYTVKDTASTDARTYTTVAWLADPTTGRAAEWAWSACGKAQPNRPNPCAKAVIDQMRRIASAAHFPVAGLYYEDLIGKDGRYEAYFFRDGVTTRLAGFEWLNGSRWPAPGQDGVALAEQAAAAEIMSMKTGMARPVAITPSAYQAATGDKAVPKDVSSDAGARSWADQVRAATIRALSGPQVGAQNDLVTAWACSALQNEVSPYACFHRRPAAP